jgi:hypothetical protein
MDTLGIVAILLGLYAFATKPALADAIGQAHGARDRRGLPHRDVTGPCNVADRHARDRCQCGCHGRLPDVRGPSCAGVKVSGAACLGLFLTVEKGDCHGDRGVHKRRCHFGVCC